MEADRLSGALRRDGGLLPGLSGRPYLQWLLLSALVVLVVVDAAFWHGLLFDSRLWHAFLWGLVPGGLAIGGFAYCRRER